MTSIGSYVFFDIETTGLPLSDLGDTKITEMTFVGVARSHFDVEPFSLPRVVNTLTLCLNPMGHISHMASSITGLTNEMLDIMGPFNEEVCQTMTSFIDRLPQPACLISHNGDRFDFPILQSHLNSIKMALPNTLVCGDSLKAFRKLKVMERDPSEWRLLSSPPVEQEIDKVGESLHLTTLIIDELEQTCKDRDNKLLFDGNDHLFSQIADDEIQPRVGYSTPVKQIMKQPRTPVKNESGDVRTETTPSVKRRLYETNQYSYKLGSVYKHITGVEIEHAHSSQSDTMAMLAIVTAIGNPFHNYLAQNAVPFSSIKKMW